MKNLLLALLLITIIQPAYSQVKYNTTKAPKLPREGSNIVYTSTVTLDSTHSKETLFNNALNWYRHNFQSADNTLTVNDADAGKLSGTGIIHSKKTKKDIYPQDIFFTITIATARGNYQYRVDSIYGFEKNRVKFYYSDMYSEELYTQNKPTWTKPYRLSMLTNMNTRINEMTDKLRADMAKK
ncbi:MAG: hypothetical protein JWQ38_1536 [Flavipsychrobacter sp.]|nr:hypothetical protein [Flavipsychrobacter sp.]